MNTSFTDSSDGTRIAYDANGQGQAIMLLHGAGLTRAQWHEKGYVKSLEQVANVVTVDIRGNGESDRPTEKNAYRIDRLCDDLLSVADAADLD